MTQPLTTTAKGRIERETKPRPPWVGTKIVRLPAGFQSTASVEYPKGEDPPKFLDHRDYRHGRFYENDGYYDVMKRGDDSNVSELWISTKPETNEEIEVIYLGDHDSLDDDKDVTTVPEKHLELITAFVRWTAWQEISLNEELVPRERTRARQSYWHPH